VTLDTMTPPTIAASATNPIAGRNRPPVRVRTAAGTLAGNRPIMGLGCYGLVLTVLALISSNSRPSSAHGSVNDDEPERHRFGASAGIACA
jgi:hypothetical protein